MSNVVKGLKELQQYLDQLPTKIQNNIMRGALRAGMRIIAVDAKSRVRKRSSRLAKSIRYNTTRDKDRSKTVAYTRAGGRGREGKRLGAFYAHMVEFGTAPHVIKAKPNNPAGLFGKGIRQVQHPGSKSHPYMRPAMDFNQREALRAVRDYIFVRLTKRGVETPAPDPTEDLSP